MRITSVLVVVSLIGSFASAPSFSQGLTAVRPIPGYKCASLNISDKDLMDPKAVVPILAEPSAASQPIGRATSILFVGSPETKVGRFVQVLRLDGSRGWIDDRYVVPWHTPDFHPATCIPSVMSNGHLGTVMR